MAQDIHIADYPQLREIAWNRAPDDFIDEQEAFALYEANWRYVEPEALTAAERDLIDRLKEQVGAGIMYV